MTRPNAVEPAEIFRVPVLVSNPQEDIKRRDNIDASSKRPRRPNDSGPVCERVTFSAQHVARSTDMKAIQDGKYLVAGDNAQVAPSIRVLTRNTHHSKSKKKKKKTQT